MPASKRLYPGLERAAVQARAAALAGFAAWETTLDERLGPDIAVARIAALYELLPQDARNRSVDVTGVARLRRGLAVLACTRT